MDFDDNLQETVSATIIQFSYLADRGGAVSEIIGGIPCGNRCRSFKESKNDSTSSPELCSHRWYSAGNVFVYNIF